MAKLGNDTIQAASAVVASLGAINWGSAEFAGTDVLLDTLNLTGDVYTGVIAAIAVSGLLVLYNVFLVDVLDDPLDG